MKRAYYGQSIPDFLQESEEAILGKLLSASSFAVEGTQTDAWIAQISILKQCIKAQHGRIYFEYEIPRMGKRADAVVVTQHAVFVIEFKVGSIHFKGSDIDQVMDYALDLKNFHEASHSALVVPVLVATNAVSSTPKMPKLFADRVASPICVNSHDLQFVIEQLELPTFDTKILDSSWEASGYKPTPTIVEAALALYRGHRVEEISRSDAGAKNLSVTSSTISEVIEYSRTHSQKSIVFLTGVPGAGKTLVGLNVATKNFDPEEENYSVFLSGNGPLVKVLQEALARDLRDRQGVRIGEARSQVSAFIQNVHHFRDEGLKDRVHPPPEHVVLFDEAQRAWEKAKTVDFMKRKKGQSDFDQSEPEFLISYMDRHPDWAVIVCLVGGGQEIHSGEAGIVEWLLALEKSFPEWRAYASNQLIDSEYGGLETSSKLIQLGASSRPELHLKTSMRSFRSENVSLFVKNLLDLEQDAANDVLSAVLPKYPIRLTRSLNSAKNWVKEQARGTERYGIMMSSYAERLRPIGLHLKSAPDPVKWYLEGKDHVDSSFYLELAATEFHAQGLELDWSIVAWDGDFRFADGSWDHKQFRGDKWQSLKQSRRKEYQKNAYRVLLTRARQGMVVYVPEGSSTDLSRCPEFYDGTYDYLRACGIPELL